MKTVRRGCYWYCNVCGAENHEIDGECQFCECLGSSCQRDSCADPRHFVGGEDIIQRAVAKAARRLGCVALFFLLVGSAFAGEAWILWEQSTYSSPWRLVEAYETRAKCEENRISSLDRRGVRQLCLPVGAKP